MINELVPLPPRPEEFTNIKPTLETLEAITEKVFRNMGFDVSSRTKRMTKDGRNYIEVDILAEKRIKWRFSIYVSYKNWNAKIDRRVIDEEIGRISNLKELPHMKIIIVRELTHQANVVATPNGFMVIK